MEGGVQFTEVVLHNRLVSKENNGLITHKNFI